MCFQIQASLRYDQSAGLGSEGNLLRSADDVVHVHMSKKWVKARQRYNRITTRADETIEEKTNRNSAAEDESRSAGSGDAVPSNAATAFKRQWVKGENMEASVT